MISPFSSTSRIGGLMCVVGVTFCLSTVTGFATNCCPSPTGLVGWWQADGTLADVAGNHTGISPLGFANYESGVVGQAFSFDGGLFQIRIPDDNDFKLTNSLSIEGWVFAKAYGGTILSRTAGSGPNPYSLKIEANGQIQFHIESTVGIVNLLAPIPSNQWMHIAVTLDGETGDMKIYRDGIVAAQANTTLRPLGEINSTLQPSIWLGYPGGRTHEERFLGLIDEISLYARAISAAEISSIYTAGSAGKCRSPVIITQPMSQTVVSGGDVTFTVVASGAGPLSYQWRHDESAIEGATTASLTLNGVQAEDAGNYSVVVTNAFGSAISSNALLIVEAVDPHFTNGLINVNFGAHLSPGLQTNKTGVAAVGAGAGDIWNFYSRDNEQGQWQVNGTLANLKRADGQTTSVGLVVSNAPGAWSNGSSDAMYQSYIYPFSGTASVSVTNLPVGEYDFYIYANDGKYELRVGEVSYGTNQCLDVALVSPPAWEEGKHYVRFGTVSVTNPAQPVLIKVLPGNYGYAIIAGLQIIPVSEPEALKNAIVCLPGKATYVRLAGESRTIYTIQASTNLNDWEDIGSVKTGADGFCEFQDINATAYSSRYYRLILP